eukprot:124465_1
MHAIGLIICFILALTYTKACQSSNGWQPRPEPQDVTYAWHNSHLSPQNCMAQSKQEGFDAKELQHDEEDVMTHENGTTKKLAFGLIICFILALPHHEDG